MSPKSHEPPFRFGTVSIVQHSHGGEHSPALQGDALPHAQLQSQRNQSRNLSCQTRVNILEVEMGMISIGRSPRKETQWNVQRRCGYVIFSKYFLVLHNCYIRRLSNCMVIRVEYAPILMSYFFINMKQPTIGRNSWNGNSPVGWWSAHRSVIRSELRLLILHLFSQQVFQEIDFMEII
jgi:hypothetical protein